MNYWPKFFLTAFVLIYLSITGNCQGSPNQLSYSKNIANTTSARAIDSFFMAQQVNSHTANSNLRIQPPPHHTQPVPAAVSKTAVYNKPSLSTTAFHPPSYQRSATQVCYVTSGRDYLTQDSLTLWTGDPSWAANGNIIVSGQCTDYSTPIWNEAGFCMKTTPDGVKIWAKLFDSVGNNQYDYLNLFKSLELQNGSILLVGRGTNEITHNDDLVLMKLDANGNMLWSKTYASRYWQGFHGSGDYFITTDLKEDTATGELYFTGFHWGGLSTITKVDSNDGHIIWSKGYRSYYSDHAFGIQVNPSNLQLFTMDYDSYNFEYYHVININKNTGDTTGSKNFEITGDRFNPRMYTVSSMQKLNNGHFLLSGPTTRFWQYPVYTGTVDLYHAAVVELDENLNFVKGYVFKNRTQSNGYNTKTSLYKDGKGMFQMLDVISGFTARAQICLFKSDTIYHRRKRIHNNEGIPYEPLSLQLNDGGVVNIKLMGDSTQTGYGSRVDYYRIHTSDTASACIGVPDTTAGLWYFDLAPIYWYHLDSVVSNVFSEARPKTYTAFDFNTGKSPGCVVTSNCDTIHLSITPSNVCLGSTATLHIYKNPGCGSLVPLQYDTTAIRPVTYVNDSTYLLHFNTAGSFVIKGSLQGCQLLRDSLTVNVLPAGGPVNLGADSTICPGNTIILNAHLGYVSYLWQNGSSDSTFIVTQPGQYYVSVTDACGNQFSDTINVSPHAPVPVSLGPDRTMCKGDTLHINAPSGFLSYTWQPNYNISSLTAQQVVVSPLVDTIYSVKAELTPGCFGFDTVHIHVNTSPPISLGPDKSFCSGDSLVLNAGPGFTSYQWNTGQTSQQITVFNTGIYQVNAITAQGCHSYDTMQVVSIYPLPVINLDHRSLLCKGEARVLNAGTGYTSYQWSTGASTASITVQALGLYSVTVTDNNGCKGSDSTRISVIAPSPSGFLPADTAICNYGQSELRAMRVYNTYQWSTGSASSFISITQPGLYWLQVKDNNNCTGRDSINVTLKECIKGVYVPTAFTPNHDGKNDKLHPLVFGNILKYEFTVYDRAGQIIFHSVTPGEGWNGAYKGQPFNNAVFVWICKYQMAGEAEKMQKGTVALIQ